MVACVASTSAFLLAAPLHAASLDDLSWSTRNGKVTITECDQAATGPLNIPATIEGLPVTSIGYIAFENCSGLTSVTIPASITNIGGTQFSDAPFQGCSSLTSIEVDEDNLNFRSRDGILFSRSESKLIRYPAGKTESHYSVPETVASIEILSFDGCRNLTSVTLPTTMEIIPRGAFSDCSNLTSVTIPETIWWIREGAFSGCSSLVSLTIPFVGGIERFAFWGCQSLTGIEVDPANPSLESRDGVLFNEALTTLIQYPAAKNVSSYEIPESVTSLEMGAFAYCSAARITIPAGVVSIGSEAFSTSSRLTSIEVDEDNPNYQSRDGVLFNKTLTSLIQYPGGKPDPHYDLPETVTAIETGAFSACAHLATVTLPDGLQSIGYYAFLDATSLTSLTIPNSVSFDLLSDYVFWGCSNLATVTLPDELHFIPRGMFRGCSSLASITLPERVYQIQPEAFWGCSSLTSITIPANVEGPPLRDGYIGESAFRDCSSLTTVTIPTRVGPIRKWAFRDCSSLTRVFFKGQAPSVDSGAFDGVASSAEALVWPQAAASFGGVGATWHGLTVALLEIIITDLGLVDEDTFFLEFSPGGLGFKVTMASNLNFSNATDVIPTLEPATAGDRRFEFQVSGTRNFFRVEPQ